MASQISVGLGSKPSLSINLPKLGSKSVCFGRLGAKRLNIERKWSIKASSASNGIYSSKQYELSLENVDMVLEEVRPYLISDGGNVDVVSVVDGVISLQLLGACGSCPSSTTTMKMGIERVLKEKFGDAVKHIKQVNDEPVNETTVEAVNRHLDILRPAIKNYGGEVDVMAIEGGDCTVKYDGPDTIGSGIKAAIKEKFPEIVNVIFT
ncbi:hypothetical protein RND81_02G001700 [Saponaria officinalis]|uniref:NIF system FeS cluster assembly NifU C-terminal domain-containing protein n=1 Tax=Saponaria officinalis TaxID=3572 RepID=A0AAW1MPL1_SAPOF